MIIDRAIEKLKQNNATAAKTTAQTAGRSASVEAAHRRVALVDATHPIEKPTFPSYEIDARSAETNRILLPHVYVGDDGGAGASYRMLRTRLLQKLRANRWTSLAVTSPGAGEGKSLTCLNLALSMARDKSTEVFLIDLDMRNPSVCNYLGVRPPRDIVSYFAGEGSPASTMFTIGVDNLVVAGSATATDQASELLVSGRFEELIAYISTIATNPVVIIDLPPVLVTDEALLVAPRVDATALVVAEGRTRRDSLGRARQLLSDYSFAGVILNCAYERFGADTYYGYGYREQQAPKR
jgi:protein-tyrosine kinase